MMALPSAWRYSACQTNGYPVSHRMMIHRFSAGVKIEKCALMLEFSPNLKFRPRIFLIVEGQFTVTLVVTACHHDSL
jgi:hypothetical protein